MRGDGLSNVDIGAKTGVSGVFIGNILKKEDPKPVSKKVWDALVNKCGLIPVEPEPTTTRQETDSVNRPDQLVRDPNTITVDRAQFKELLEHVRMQTHLLNALVSKLDK